MPISQGLARRTEHLAAPDPWIIYGDQRTAGLIGGGPWELIVIAVVALTTIGMMDVAGWG
jgi:hypothetical protein